MSRGAAAGCRRHTLEPKPAAGSRAGAADAMTPRNDRVRKLHPLLHCFAEFQNERAASLMQRAKKIAFRIQINATQIRFRPYFKSRQNNNKKIPLVSKLKVTSFLPLLLSLLPTRDKVLESGLMEKRKVAAPSTQKANKAKTSDFSMR